MRYVELSFLEVHTPLFFGSVSFGLKLNPKHRQGLKLVSDREKKMFYASYNGQLAEIQPTNVSHSVPVRIEDLIDDELMQLLNIAKVTTPLSQEPPKPVETIRRPGRPPNKVSAQVSTPQGNLHELGHGQTGLSTKV